MNILDAFKAAAAAEVQGSAQKQEAAPKNEPKAKANYIDTMVSNTLARFNRSKLKTVRDNLGLNPKDGKYCISGDLGYMSLRLFYCGAEVRQYDNGKVFVYFDYDDRVGAWGGYTSKYEVKDLDVFKSPRWKSIIKSEGVKTSPDVIMI